MDTPRRRATRRVRDRRVGTLGDDSFERHSAGFAQDGGPVAAHVSAGAHDGREARGPVVPLRDEFAVEDRFLHGQLLDFVSDFRERSVQS
jgi:hypothetical protein